MRYPIFYIIIQSLISFSAYCQGGEKISKVAEHFSVEGRIKSDKNEAPIPFSPVMLLDSKDSSLVRGAVTDSSGYFRIEKIAEGNYVISFSSLGFEKFYSSSFILNNEQPLNQMGNIILIEKSQLLKEVLVQAERPAVERAGGKIIVNAGNSAFKTANTALDVLKRSPGVLVSGDGGLTLQGSTTPVVTIDGKNVPLSPEEIKSIPAGDIDQIEIINNPGANYEGDRKGVINIKMKKDKNLGLNGTSYAEYTRHRHDQYAAGGNFNYRAKKLVLFGRYNYSQYTGFLDMALERRFNNSDAKEIFNTNTRMKTVPLNHNVNIGADYYIGKKSTIGFMLRGNNNDNETITNSSTNVSSKDKNNLTSLNTNNQSNSLSNNGSVNINYMGTLGKKGDQLSVNLDYSQYHNTQNQLLIATYNIPEDQVNSLNGRISSNLNIKSIRADYALPVSDNTKLSAGFKSSMVHTATNMNYDTLISNTWSYDAKRSNVFSYEESTNAGYALFNQEINNFSLELGTRVENTITHGNSITSNSNVSQHYWKFLPSLRADYKFDDNNKLSLTYSRKITRPGFQDLNPFKFYLDPYTYTEGNPYLMPVNINKANLSYSYKQFATSVFYTYNTSLFKQMPQQNDSTKITTFTRVNLDREEVFSWDFWLPFTVTKWWKMQNYLVVSHNRFHSKYLDGTINKSQTSYNININNYFKLPKSFNLSVGFNYQSGGVETFYTYKPQYNFSVGVNKSFLMDKININVYLNDIFWTLRDRVYVNYLSINSSFVQKGNTQYGNIRLTYKFGKSLFRRNNKNAGSTDEENRVKMSF